MSRAKVTPLKTYEVTGVLKPDVRGSYEDAGEHNGKRYYQHTPDGWFIWWDGFVNWLISRTLGEIGVEYWLRHAIDIEGDYYPQLNAIGDATVTEI